MEEIVDDSVAECYECYSAINDEDFTEECAYCRNVMHEGCARICVDCGDPYCWEHGGSSLCEDCLEQENSDAQDR